MALKYGLVVGHFAEVVGDRGASDPDRYPDEIGSAGRVTFKPTPATITDQDSPTGQATLIVPRSVEALLDSAGHIVDASGATGIWLVAGIEYTVTASFMSLGTVKIVPTEANDLEHPMDLVKQIPIVPAPSVKFVVNEQVYSDTLAAADAALAAALRAEAAAGAEGDAIDSTARQRAEQAYSLAAGRYEVPQGGIPEATLADAVRTMLAAGASAVQPATLASYTPTNRSVSAGTGLTGGGTLTADRTIGLSAATIASLGRADTAVQPSALATALMAKADATALATKADLVNGVLPTSQLPALAINDIFPVSSQAAMLALTAQRGDMAIRSDTSTTWVLSTDDPTQLANWLVLPTPTATAPVQSVNGQTGIIVLGKADVGLGNVSNLAPADLPVSSATSTALGFKAPIASPTFTGTPAAPTATAGTNTTQIATTAFVATATSGLAPKASPTFTGTVSGITAAMVGAVAHDGNILRVLKITSSAYAALATKDANTLYVVVG